LEKGFIWLQGKISACTATLSFHVTKSNTQYLNPNSINFTELYFKEHSIPLQTQPLFISFGGITTEK
jgi:hypothetical protein